VEIWFEGQRIDFFMGMAREEKATWLSRPLEPSAAATAISMAMKKLSHAKP
jgi:hypothetical protein